MPAHWPASRVLTRGFRDLPQRSVGEFRVCVSSSQQTLPIRLDLDFPLARQILAVQVRVITGNFSLPTPASPTRADNAVTIEMQRHRQSSKDSTWLNLVIDY
jgi:hypothetical protein